MATKNLCSIPECCNPAQKRGWCGAHYQRWHRHGDTLTGKPLRPSPGSRMGWVEDHANYQDDDCLRWPFCYEPNGYGQISDGGVNTSANRIMCELAHGPAPSPQYESAHNCGKGHEGCLNPNHLRWSLPVENQADRIIHGTDVRGEKNVHAKVKEDDVREIRRLYGAVGPTALVRRYGISKTAVMKIHKRENWAWLE
jgi:hypothetical protein